MNPNQVKAWTNITEKLLYNYVAFNLKVKNFRCNHANQQTKYSIPV